MSRLGLTPLKKITEPPLRGDQFTVKERVKQIDNLKKEKKQLIGEIKKFSEIVFELKEGAKKAEGSLKDMTTDRLKVISNISQEISASLKKEADGLKDVSIKLDKRDIFLQELFAYTSKTLKLTVDARLRYEKKMAEVDNKLSLVLKDKKNALELISQAQDKKQKADDLLDKIGTRHKVVDKFTKWFEEEADREKHRLGVWAGALELREKRVAKEKRGLKRIEKKNDDKAIWLLDRERMLGRTMSEVRKAESDIIRNGRRKIKG